MQYAQDMLQHLDEGNLTKAKKTFHMTLEKGSDEEKFFLGEELFQLGFMEESKELFESLLSQYPEEGELKVMIAECLVEMDKEEEAIHYLENIEPDDPNYPRALLLAADLYQMQGLFEVSEQKLLRANAILPEENVIKFALGELYSEQGRFSEAADMYLALLKGNVETLAGANIHQRMAEVLSGGGAFEQALEHYEKSITSQVEPNTLFGFAFTAYQAGFYKKSIEKFTELKELDPDYHSLYLYLAKAYEHEEELEESMKAVYEGIKHDEFNKDLFFYGGKISLKLGDEEKAEEMLRGALVLDPDFLEAALTLNKLLLKQERYDDVLEIIEMMEKEGEADPQFLWDAATSNSKLERYSDALKYYRSAYNDFKTNNDFLEEFGYFLIEEGQSAEAAQIFKSLLSHDPANEEYISLLERLEEL
ncbi:tetratricopeptide repeat protein [Falsibacillus pallidus]|uniref:tetratricopeptide repeat protein n=1 Tax=Falsibacillus pallidus TaxID=493781 RepID=UPI003D975397